MTSALAASAIVSACGSPPIPSLSQIPTDDNQRRGVGGWQMFSINGYPQGIVRVMNGDFWIADGYMSDTLSRLTPTGNVTYYAIGYEPLEMTSDAHENFWLTVARTLNVVIRVTRKLEVSSFNLSDDTCGGITYGGDGKIWFAQNNHVGSITPAGKVTEYQTPELEGSSGITWTPGGLVWFETYRGLTTLDPRSGTVKTHDTPPATGGAIVAGPRGTLWYLVHVTGSVTLISYNPKTDHTASYVAPTNFLPYGAPASMILQENSLWYTAQRLAGKQVKHVVGGGLVRFDLKSHRFTAYAAPKGYQANWDITGDSNGNLWATASTSVTELVPKSALF
ncbi:MAG: hypothetical protein JO113_01635 [Candidatus Eremiobacteraeota bacterium]|nr:hypothetical protein [Candidatus Eremiobacteraeota bacterium]